MARLGRQKPVEEQESQKAKAYSMTWAQRLKRVFAINPAAVIIATATAAKLAINDQIEPSQIVRLLSSLHVKNYFIFI